MATDDDNNEGRLRDLWGTDGFEVVSSSFPPDVWDDIVEDEFAIELIDSGYMNFGIDNIDKDTARDMIDEYFYDHFEYEFAEMFDWDAYRDWYGSF